ncbi:MAG: methyltransferase domain-containing protein, partial [Methanothrix sp.]
MKDRITRHWDGRAKAYDENVRPVIYSPRERRIWQEIFSEAIGSTPLRILDVGTGPGILSNLLSELGHEVTGIDASEGMLKRARSNS